MLHAKFQDHRTLKVSIYGHGGHLGHVICTIYINFQKAPHEVRH